MKEYKNPILAFFCEHPVVKPMKNIFFSFPIIWKYLSPCEMYFLISRPQFESKEKIILKKARERVNYIFHGRG